MTVFLTVVHVLMCVLLIVIVLIQRGKGAEIGAVFGGGASSTVFGSRGAGNFLTKLTTGAAITFMVTSLWLSYIANTAGTRSIFDEEGPAPPPAAAAPAAPESGFQEVPAAAPGADAGAAEPDAASLAPAEPDAAQPAADASP